LATEKTALVVVHGVADQLPGATAKSIVDLLVATASTGAAYRSLGSRDLTLSVPPLSPCFDAERVDGPSPQAADRSLFKSFLQSYRSDFQRQRWEAPTAVEVLAERKAAKATEAHSTPAPAAPAAPSPDMTAKAAATHAAGPAGPDRGLAFTDYLLGKQRDNGGLQEAYETTCIELERKAAARPSGSMSTRCTGPTCRASRVRSPASLPSSAPWSSACRGSAGTPSTKAADSFVPTPARRRSGRR
jgi:hypothetical protein